MNFLQKFSHEMECACNLTISQSQSLWKETRDTAVDFYKSIEFYTDLTAKYIFAIDRSPKNCELILVNFVTPLSLAGAGTLLFAGRSATLCLATAAGIYTLVIAKKNRYF